MPAFYPSCLTFGVFLLSYFSVLHIFVKWGHNQKVEACLHSSTFSWNAWNVYLQSLCVFKKGNRVSGWINQWAIFSEDEYVGHCLPSLRLSSEIFFLSSEMIEKNVLTNAFSHKGTLQKLLSGFKGFWAGWFSVKGGRGCPPIPLRKILLKSSYFFQKLHLLPFFIHF